MKARLSLDSHAEEQRGEGTPRHLRIVLEVSEGVFDGQGTLSAGDLLTSFDLTGLLSSRLQKSLRGI